MTLTKSGWPRPVVEGFPIPWVSPSEDLSTMHPGRAAACASGAICAVCGEGFGEGDQAIALVKSDNVPALKTVLVQAMDNAFMHHRCARLALSVCPKLKSLHSSGLLQAVKTAANNARVKVDKKRHVVGFLDGADCELVAVDSIKGRADG
jgi:hypothetical protein